MQQGPGRESAIPKPFSYGACISLWRSIEKNVQKSPRIALELPTFGSTEQCFTNYATNKALRNVVY